MCTHSTIQNKSDVVGSFLRPEALKKAREQFANNQISASDLKLIEDEEIIKLIENQKEAGLTALTDGEFRRSYWHLDFFWGLGGIEHFLKDQGYLFQGEETRKDSARLSGKIKFNPEHPVFESFLFLKKHTGKNHIARQSIPAPAQLYAELVRGNNEEYVKKFYPNQEELYKDIAEAYQQTILKLYNLGCRDLKIDDCTWAMICDTNFWKTMAGEGFDRNLLKETYLKLNNLALENLPEDLRLSTHVCRGNYHSTWAASGGYEPVADTLFAKEAVENFYLEFDDDRSGDFEPLRFVPKNKNVVLGLLTSKNATLENKQVIIDRIKEATQYVDLERLSLSPQCGFASTEEGNILTEEDQWKKIKLINEITEEVWG
ncbi:5-methyltetrahydropteroyltriglutamate--homocysteine S-methyltransferase [Zunongwangia endophytica]|uniref:5-methyltetrahydropteroyltriglutamate--homocysteine S-methyltransferase n=1 Tax=Zunongwangia endophytica TaxID=1808945 RepID=A0ABV8H9K4_9FLAO|nr:5-methyltetrahydropteroyltriglutamate--homocysteine S-methyltransferase [Zunongwangia endophytica]MDN3595552.1 5-methyltetrahydropteroyltriglutamate--homocysteine S-methyltransferase [Zunongwangia endophytica]